MQRKNGQAKLSSVPGPVFLRFYKVRPVNGLEYIAVEPVADRLHAAEAEEFRDCMEGKSPGLQLRNNRLQCFHCIDIPFHVMQKNNFPVFCVGQGPAGTLLR